jgi:O-antigen/teichoic acid export membrane protein
MTCVEAKTTAVVPSSGKSLLRQVLEGSAWNGAAIAISRLAPSFLTILLAWWLDPRELGIIAFVLAYYAVLSLFADWSIAYAVQKVIPENVELTAGIAWTALVLRLGFSTLLALLCWSLDSATHAFRGYGMYLGLLLVTSSFGILVCIHNARCNFAASSLLNIFFQIGWIGLSVFFVKAGMRTTGPLLGLAFSYAILGIPAFVFGSLTRSGMKFLPRMAAEIIRFGIWGTLASVLSGIATQGGLLVIAYMAGDAAAGIYRVATTFGMLPAVLGMIVVTPLMPVVKRGLLDGSDVTANLILPLVRYLLMVGLPIAVTAAMFAKSVIGTFVHDSYSSAAGPLCFCLAANVLLMLMTVFSGILFVGDGLKDLAKIQASVGIIAVAGAAILTPMTGVEGPAIALLIAWSLGVALLYRWFVRRTPLPLEWRTYVRYFASACVASTVAAIATRIIGSPRIRLLLGSSIASVLYWLFLWLQADVGCLQLMRAMRRSLPGKTVFSS